MQNTTADILRFTVGGGDFNHRLADLKRYPKSRLALVAAATPEELRGSGLCDGVLHGRPYFDRSQALYDRISNVYHQNVVYMPDSVCPILFLRELNYWGISLNHLDVGSQQRVALLLHREWRELFFDAAADAEELKGKTARLEHAKRHVWNLLDHPTSSKLALAISITTMVFVVITVLLLMLSSYRTFREVDPTTNSTVWLDTIEMGDSVCVAYFTVEFLLRAWSCPSRSAFIRNPLCIIDGIAVIPYYVEVILAMTGTDLMALEDFKRQGLQSIGAALKRSWKELTMLVLFMLTAELLFSTAMYHLEVDDPETKFTSIPAAGWWCVITMTTVGYGDLYPRTVAGKLLGCIVSITGVILLAFPVSVIVENFHNEYHGQQLDDDSPKGHKNKAVVYVDQTVLSVDLET